MQENFIGEDNQATGSWQVRSYGNISPELRQLFTTHSIPFFIYEWTEEMKDAGQRQQAIHIIRPDGKVGLEEPDGDYSRISEYISENIISNKSNEMEVHHHPDLEHKKKNFREYFLEFLMIFLAVTLGFLAENLRERITDNSKEKEYIESMVQDLKTDTAKASRSIRDMRAQIFGMDTLEMLLNPNINENDRAVFTCYRQSKYMFDENTMIFSSRTITQLFSSGNMRLIKKQAVSDRISEYYSAIRNADAQKAYYIDYFQKCLDIFLQIYSFDSYHTRVDTMGKIYSTLPEFGKVKIADTNPGDLQKFKSTIELTKGIIASYRDRIENLNTEATSLIEFLRKEYRLKDS
jgi:cell division protein FtsB